MSTEYLCKFEHYRSNLAANFQKFLENGKHSDVTLVCDDDKQLKLHKVILASCSETFNKMFSSNTSSSTTVYLRGVGSRSMKLLVKFMYAGSVTVPEMMLPDLLKLGEDLKVLGLVVPAEELLQPSVLDGDGGLVVPAEKLHQPAGPTLHLVVPGEDVGGPSDQVVPPHFLELTSEQVPVKVTKATDDTAATDWVCETCHVILSSKMILKRHMKKHTGVKLPCVKCGKVFSRKDALKVHYQDQHSDSDAET